MNTRSRLLLFILIPALAFCANLVPFSQLGGPPQLGVMVTAADGSVHQAVLGPGITLTVVSGQYTLNVQSTATAPMSVVSLVVNASTPNSFACPTGKVPFIVDRNIPQLLGVEYTLVAGAVVFNPPPVIGDSVRIVCQ